MWQIKKPWTLKPHQKTHLFTRGSRMSLLPWSTTQPLTKQQTHNIVFFIIYGILYLRYNQKSDQYSHFSSFLSFDSIWSSISTLSLDSLRATITKRSFITLLTLQPTVLSMYIIYIKPHSTMHLYEMKMANIQHQRICTHRQAFASCWSDWSSFTHWALKKAVTHFI